MAGMPKQDVMAELRKQIKGALAALVLPGRGVVLRSAPGRLDVLGGLGAQAGGTVAQMTLPRRAAVAVQLRDQPELVIQSSAIGPPVGEPVVKMALGRLYREGAEGGLIAAREVPGLLGEPEAWALPIVALWYTLAQTTGRTAAEGGATFLIHSSVPMGAGQASSTAVVTAALLALVEAEGARGRPAEGPLELALWVQRAESMARTGAGHVIDVLACLLAEEPAGAGGAGGEAGPKLLRFSAQPHQLVGPVALPWDVRIMALDTGVRYNSAHETLEGLRLAGAMGLRIVETIYRELGQRHTPLHGYLANTSPLLYRQYFRPLLPKRLRGSDFVRVYGELPERAGPLDPAGMYRVRTAVDHLISEHVHAEQFLQAMEELADGEGTALEREAAVLAGERREKILQRAGRLALASHHSYRLRLELSCREADWLVDRLMEAGPERGVYGARITGCGGGGTVMAVVGRSKAANDALLDVYEAYNKITGVGLDILEAGTAGSGGGVGAG
jgi:galactokinase